MEDETLENKRNKDGKEINGDRLLKGSFTLEAAVLVPMLIAMYVLMINTGFDMYVEIQEEKEQEAQADLWMVDDFYRYQILKEVINDK